MGGGLRGIAFGMGLLMLFLLGSGCGSGASGEDESGGSRRILSSSQAKKLLLQLPYQYRFRRVALPKGATGAVAGTMIGQRHAVVHFGLSLGEEPEPVPFPKAGTSGAFYYLRAGYVFTDDLIVPGSSRVGNQFHTDAQWYEAGDMVLAIEEKLCKEMTGEPCQE